MTIIRTRKKENKNCWHGFGGKLSDNKLAKFQLNRFRDCRLGVENVRLTFRNFLSEKTRKIYFLRHLTRNRIILTTWPGAHFSKVTKRFRTQKAAANTQTLITNTELFYSHIGNLNTSSLHTGSFRCIRLSVLEYGLTENDFAFSKGFRGLTRNGPSSQTLPVGLIAHLEEHCSDVQAWIVCFLFWVSSKPNLLFFRLNFATA